MEPTPARNGAKVRTSGTKRAKKIAAPPYFSKKNVGAIDVLFLYQGGEPFKKEMKADIIPDPVIDGISYDCSKNNRNEKRPDIEHAARCCSTANEEQRISREEREDDKTRFKEDDEEQDEVRPETVFLDHRGHVLIDMEENGYQRVDHVFRKKYGLGFYMNL